MGEAYKFYNDYAYLLALSSSHPDTRHHQLARYHASEAGIRAREKADAERRYAAKAAELDSNINYILVTLGTGPVG